MLSSVLLLFLILSGGTSIFYKISKSLLFMPILASLFLAQIIIPTTEHKFKFRNNFLNSKP